MSSNLNSSSILQKTFIQSPINILSPKDAVHASEKISLAEAIEILHAKKIGSLLLCDQQDQLKGIITDRDLVIKQLSCGDSRASQPVAEFMTKDPQTLKSNASIARALHLMSIGGFRHIPILPIKNGPIKVISSTNLFQFIHERLTSHIVKEDNSLFFDANAVDMFFVSDLSILKYSTPVIVKEDTPVLEAAGKMKSAKQNACFVISDNGSALGIFTDRDFLMKVAIKTSALADLRIGDVMTRSPSTLMSTSSVAFAFNLLVDKGFRILPIVDVTEKLVGVLGVNHFINYLAQQIISTLEAKRS